MNKWIILVLILLKCVGFSTTYLSQDDWREKLETFRHAYKHYALNDFIPQKELLDTNKETSNEYNEYQGNKHNYVILDNVEKKQCPVKFPKRIPTLSQLPNICSNLKDFKIHGNCNVNNCSKCIPPGSESMPWVDKDIIPFFHVYDETLISRRRKLESILSHLNPSNKKEPIILIVFNYGYSYLFFNWICSIEFNSNVNDNVLEYVRKHLLVITTDIHAKHLVESKGFLAYYPTWLGKLLKRIDHKAADRFANGPHRWTVSMQISTLNDLIQLGYDVILQDTDVVWYKNPIPYLTQTHLQSIDLQMTVDGRVDNRGPGNSGFFIIRSNCKTKIFMSTMISLVTLVIVGRSDQILWNVLIDEKIFRQMHFQTLPTNLFVGGPQVSVKPNRPKTKRKDLSDNHFIVHVCWTTDIYDKIEKLSHIDHWYFTNEKCPNYFNHTLLPDLKDRQWYIRDKMQEQEIYLKGLGYVKDSTNGIYKRPDKK